MTRRLYTGPIIDVSFDGEVCRHAAECIRGMPGVFDAGARPWINPASASSPALAEQLRDVVGRCPSGALEIVEHDG